MTAPGAVQVGELSHSSVRPESILTPCRRLEQWAAVGRKVRLPGSTATRPLVKGVWGMAALSIRQALIVRARPTVRVSTIERWERRKVVVVPSSDFGMGSSGQLVDNATQDTGCHSVKGNCFGLSEVFLVAVSLLPECRS